MKVVSGADLGSSGTCSIEGEVVSFRHTVQCVVNGGVLVAGALDGAV